MLLGLSLCLYREGSRTEARKEIEKFWSGAKALQKDGGQAHLFDLNGVFWSEAKFQKSEAEKYGVIKKV